ncbi:hypothetical protein TCAL_15356 [Tigriopus californicus]|uniref:Uncharacterized protein n=1 Tax=Tigriopus californicus TaxID=6832 RepID=A0A553PKW5_TIGCA|nr:hypothetical protein TCAL_15356 [Tigriopus californicus]
MVATDLFQYGGAYYMIYVDCFSGFMLRLFGHLLRSPVPAHWIRLLNVGTDLGRSLGHRTAVVTISIVHLGAYFGGTEN